jgi:hypothetical protein
VFQRTAGLVGALGFFTQSAATNFGHHPLVRLLFDHQNHHISDSHTMPKYAKYLSWIFQPKVRASMNSGDEGRGGFV